MNEEVSRYYQNSDTELSRRDLSKDYAEYSPAFFRAALAHRYGLYPHIPVVADFEAFAGKKVLEVGVGHGADHYMFAKAGADLFGVDLTRKHCEVTTKFLATFGHTARVARTDACLLPFPDTMFDHVYSCGVLLLVKDMPAALKEIYRVLKPGGSATIMLYNRTSVHYWIKTLLYYGWVCGEKRTLGFDRLVDWYTDGIGYPKTYHYGPSDLPRLFGDFSRIEYLTDCLTPEQFPEIGLPKSERVRRYIETRWGFFLWIRVTK